VSLRARLDKLEQRAGPLSNVVVLKDGTRIPFSQDARLEAFCALMDGWEHPLLEVLPRIDLAATPVFCEFVALVEAFGRGEGDDRGREGGVYEE
jgi:hypothetical protein